MPNDRDRQVAHGLCWPDGDPDETTASVLAAYREECVKPLREENARLRTALERIANPVEQMLKECPPGYVFDGGMAHRIASDPNYAVMIARAALAKEEEGKS